ncbi:MAG: SDR family oxidoreductase [Candidatus Lambdaproteobacteria bacterium]|nr:SDR family oxidoreductase [Candidatus Lambdaproteobacteria bacterium]
MSFEGQTVIVTGGGSGIGREIAHGFARGGARLVLASRRRERLEAVAAELRALGAQALVHPTDVAREPEVQAMVEAALGAFGRVDVLVNDAAIHGPTALARDIAGAAWRETLDVNLTGAFYCAKHAAAPMVAARRGCIVNIASIAGRIGYALRTPYAASKWGLIGLSHSLAAELGPHGIRVNAVLPGPVEGERFREVIRSRARALGKPETEIERWFLAGIPLQRPVSAQEVAATVLFLASDAASGITGQAIQVCAGFRMQ